MLNFNRPYRLWFIIDNTKTYLDFTTKIEARQWAHKAQLHSGVIENTITHETISI